MNKAASEQAYLAGRAIPGACTARQLTKAVSNFSGLLPDDISDEERVPPWAKPGGERYFLIGQAREDAVGFGTRVLLRSELMLRPIAGDASDSLEVCLGEFRRGLVVGGMGRTTVKALMSREIFREVEDLYRRTSYAAFSSAQSLTQLGRDMHLLGWRDRGDIWLERAAHRIRHRAPRRIVELATGMSSASAPSKKHI